jgi:hypothetical protein
LVPERDYSEISGFHGNGVVRQKLTAVSKVLIASVIMALKMESVRTSGTSVNF